MAKLKTGRHTSAIKETRKAARRTDRNVAIKSEIRTSVKKVEAAVKNKDAKLANETLNIAFSKWDTAAKKNVISKNAASNQKARLSKMVSTLSK